MSKAHQALIGPDPQGFNKDDDDSNKARWIAEGRRLERRLIKRWVANQRLLYQHDYTNLENKLAARSKRGRRKT